MWEYYEEERIIYIQMLDAAKAGEDKKAFTLAEKIKDCGHIKMKKWVEHILLNYRGIYDTLSN